MSRPNGYIEEHGFYSRNMFPLSTIILLSQNSGIIIHLKSKISRCGKKITRLINGVVLVRDNAEIFENGMMSDL